MSKIVACDISEHIREKSMWAGTEKRTPLPNYQTGSIDKNPYTLKLEHSPAILKEIDEVIANIADLDKISEVNINFDKEIIIQDNGDGIPIEKTYYNGKEICTADMALSIPLAGSYLKKSSEINSAGENGIGLKLLTHKCIYCYVKTTNNGQTFECLYEYKDKLYKNNQLENVMPRKARKNEHGTIIRFLPDYEKAGYSLTNEEMKELLAWINYRAICLSAYKMISVNVNKINYNCDIIDLMRYCFTDKIETIAVKYNKYVWHIGFSFSRCKSKGVFVINGVLCSPEKGPKDILINLLTPIIDKKIKTYPKEIRDRIEIKIKFPVIVAIGSFPSKDLWSAQTKDRVSIKKEILNKFKPTNYDVLDNVANQLIENSLDNINIPKKTKSGKNLLRSLANIKNVEPALDLSSGKNLTLIIAEGNSAISMMRSLPQEQLRKISLLTTGGVTMNAIKNSSYSENKIYPSSKLEDNQFIKTFCTLMNTNLGSVIHNPKHQKIVIAVDADIDGAGGILGSLLATFSTYWKELIYEKRVFQLLTPVVRAYKKNSLRKHKNLLETFYSESEYREWERKGIPHDPVYFKGLAGHNSEERKDILDNFVRNLRSFQLQDSCFRAVNDYFGKETQRRKEIITEPLIPQTPEIGREKLRTVGKHLDIDTRLYFKETSSRTILDAVDGLVPVSRVIVSYAIEHKEFNKKPMQVYQAAGLAAAQYNYHHGEMSLNNAFFTLMQDFPNRPKVQLLIPEGEGGTYLKNGKDHGQPRYVYTRSADIIYKLFPREDIPLYERPPKEGHGQPPPQYYVPTLPLSLLMTYDAVGKGWKQNCVSIDKNTIWRLLSLTLSNHNIKETDFILQQPRESFVSPIFKIDDKFISWAKIRYISDEEIEVYTVPFGMSVDAVIKKMMMSKLIDGKPTSSSGHDRVCIRAFLKENHIPARYLAKTLGLVNHIQTNMIWFDPDILAPREFSYKQLFEFWFNKRLDLYVKRMEYQKLIYTYKYHVQCEILRFINDYFEKLKNETKNMDEIQIEKLLKTWKFEKKLKTLSCNYEELMNESYKSGENYDYILDLRARDATDISIKRRQEKINKIEKELIKINYHLSTKIPCSELFYEEAYEAFKCL